MPIGLVDLRDDRYIHGVAHFGWCYGLLRRVDGVRGQHSWLGAACRVALALWGSVFGAGALRFCARARVLCAKTQDAWNGPPSRPTGFQRLSDATLRSTRLWPGPGPDAQPSARARRCPRQALEKDSWASPRTADHACGCRDEQDAPPHSSALTSGEDGRRRLDGRRGGRRRGRV